MSPHPDSPRSCCLLLFKLSSPSFSFASTFTLFFIVTKGEWDKAGACPVTKPFKKLEGMDAEMRGIEVEEIEATKRGNELAATVQVCFDKIVAKQLRRGIGRHLLKASEELIPQMASSKVVHLHCRIIDEAPFNMYMKAGYHVVQTDNVLILSTLQMHVHLMCKNRAEC
ncbi:hypothetical protein V6N13_074998 [Hibiscus sabdariffa]|uniref:Glucosamine-phosphate N-acetyltransferase n=1 Tax=Hibiscus sabdariffa TaxID=183260 RepID=A0ABR2UAH2_9ROSI